MPTVARLRRIKRLWSCRPTKAMSMPTDRDNLLPQIRGIIEHTRRSDACCADNRATLFMHATPMSDKEEELLAQAYAETIVQDVLDIEAIQEAEANKAKRRRNRPKF